MYRLFIVEDDDGIAEGICKKAEAWGFETHVCHDLSRVTEEFVALSPHLVLMDVGLPFFDGYHWCREIRRLSDVPILFLTSAADDRNAVMAMNMGADDLIAKPFDGDVLIAKIGALLRRAYDYAPSSPVLSHRGAFLRTDDGTLTYDGQTVELTKNEYRILLCLMENHGAVVSREKLMERLWESDAFVDENTLTVNVNRLRRKLETVGLTDFIATRPGVGYQVR